MVLAGNKAKHVSFVNHTTKPFIIIIIIIIIIVMINFLKNHLKKECFEMLSNLENVLQRNLKTGRARECILRAFGATNGDAFMFQCI